MHNNLETQDLDIPKDDIECWEKYPKYRWVYEMSRLLDAQNIKWFPYNVDGFVREINMDLHSVIPLIKQPGYIYINQSHAEELITEVYITKGEIKLIRHIDTKTNKEILSLNGSIELKLNAFVSLHFSKFTGVISVRTSGIEIYRIQLRPYAYVINDTNAEALRLKKKIYKKSDLTFNGPTDQALHERIAS